MKWKSVHVKSLLKTRFTYVPSLLCDMASPVPLEPPFCCCPCFSFLSSGSWPFFSSFPSCALSCLFAYAHSSTWNIFFSCSSLRAMSRATPAPPRDCNAHFLRDAPFCLLSKLGPLVLLSCNTLFFPPCTICCGDFTCV